MRRVATGAVRWALCHSGCSSRLAKRHASNIIIMYHGVELRFEKSLEGQIRYLKGNFDVVSIEEIISESLGKLRPRLGLVALTFDDGLRNNYTVAYPVLQKENLPATFYVCPGLIGVSRSIWTYEARARLARFGPEQWISFVESVGIRERNDIDSVVAWMKRIPISTRGNVETAIRRLTPNFCFREEEHEKFDLMDWKEIGALDPKIITIGSHSMSHADLTQVELPRLEEELSASKGVLETRLQRPIEHFSYPNGSYNEAVIKHVRRYYTAAVTVNCGGIGPGDNGFALKRINADFDLPRFAWRLARHAGREHRC